MADATGQPLDKIEEDTDRDFFMTPEEAMEYGIIDEVPLLHKPSLSALLPEQTRAQSSLVLPACVCVSLSQRRGRRIGGVGMVRRASLLVHACGRCCSTPNLLGLACGIEAGKREGLGVPGGEGQGRNLACVCCDGGRKCAHADLDGLNLRCVWTLVKSGKSST